MRVLQTRDVAVRANAEIAQDAARLRRDGGLRDVVIDGGPCGKFDRNRQGKFEAFVCRAEHREESRAGVGCGSGAVPRRYEQRTDGFGEALLRRLVEECAEVGCIEGRRIVRGVAVPGVPGRRDLPDRRNGREDVVTERPRPTFEKPLGLIRRRTDHEAFVARLCGEPEIQQRGLARRADHDVCRLDIAMDDAVLVHEGNRGEQPVDERMQLTRREFATDAFAILTRDEAERADEQLLAFEGRRVVGDDDIRGRPLALETAQDFDFVPQRLFAPERCHLEHDFAREIGALGDDRAARGARTQFANDAIIADARRIVPPFFERCEDRTQTRDDIAHGARSAQRRACQQRAQQRDELRRIGAPILDEPRDPNRA